MPYVTQCKTDGMCRIKINVNYDSQGRRNSFQNQYLAMCVYAKFLRQYFDHFHMQQVSDAEKKINLLPFSF